STSAGAAPEEFVKNLDQPIKGTRIGIPKEYFVGGLDMEVKAKIEAGIRVYESLGCEMQEISLPHTEYAVATYYLVATAEASSNLARYDGVRYGLREGGNSTLQEMYRRTRHNGFGAGVKRRIMLGTYALSAGYYDAYYGQGQRVCTLIIRDFDAAYAAHELLLAATSPTSAAESCATSENPLPRYRSGVCTVLSSL